MPGTLLNTMLYSMCVYIYIYIYIYTFYCCPHFMDEETEVY